MDLSNEQMDFLQMIKDDFILNYKYIPNMRDPDDSQKWPVSDIIDYINGVLAAGEYYIGIDGIWLHDLREFYISEAKANAANKNN